MKKIRRKPSDPVYICVSSPPKHLLFKEIFVFPLFYVIFLVFTVPVLCTASTCNSICNSLGMSSSDPSSPSSNAQILYLKVDPWLTYFPVHFFPFLSYLLAFQSHLSSFIVFFLFFSFFRFFPSHSESWGPLYAP